METFGAASHDDVLQLLIQIALLLAAARGLGGVAQRLGQPTVVGEILAGVLLGPSLLSGFVPALGEWILPRTAVQGHLLEAVGLLGVMLLLVVTGLETDLALIRRKIGVASGVALGGLVLPFASGALLAAAIPDDLLANPSRRPVFVLFFATALSISAIPVLAKILMDMDLMRRDVGQTMLAAGMIDDITAWTMLGLVTALASAAAITTGAVLQTFGTVIVFLVATVVVGRWLVTRGLSFVQSSFRGRDMVLTLIVVLAVAWSALTHALHLEPVLGAFAIGILFGGMRRLPSDAVHKLEAMALGVFAPIFFGVAGLKVDIRAILEPRLLLLTLAGVAVATFGKVAGAYAGARFLSRQDHWTALAYGSGLNARGAVQVIIATIGLSLGILSQEMFSIIVVIAATTSLMAPVALRYCLARVQPGAEEQQRLDQEAARRSSFSAGVRHILVPVRPRAEPSTIQTIEAHLASRLTQTSGASSTLLAVSPAAGRDMASAYLTRLVAVFDDADPTTRVVVGEDPVDAILAEAAHDYDLLMVGTPRVDTAGSALFGPFLDDIVKLSPCPVLVVRGSPVGESWNPTSIVVPASGTPSSRRALDLALTVAGEDTRVHAVHVLTPMRTGTRTEYAQDITIELQGIAARMERRLETLTVEADTVQDGVVQAVTLTGADLIVAGTSVRAGTTRLHLGPRVEHLVRHAPCPVVILNG